MKTRVVLICGGRNKGNSFVSLKPLLREKVDSCIVFGEAADEIAKEWDGVIPIERAEDLEGAVKKAMERVRPNLSILFSPGCASFDQFQNYEERGRLFKQLTGKESLANTKA